ncbi:MAG: hypothetical protein J3K34DRAFT_397987 [Monoraphidium minutum]|nr:MAG: hypothetical protein J3K34DRAFT_397987 [Monoraphidium minutum]
MIQLRRPRGGAAAGRANSRWAAAPIRDGKDLLLTRHVTRPWFQGHPNAMPCLPMCPPPRALWLFHGRLGRQAACAPPSLRSAQPSRAPGPPPRSPAAPSGPAPPHLQHTPQALGLMDAQASATDAPCFTPSAPAAVMHSAGGCLSGRGGLARVNCTQ